MVGRALLCLLLGLLLYPFETARNEHVSTEALLKISQGMARVLDRLTAPRATIDSVRKHGVE